MHKTDQSDDNFEPYRRGYVSGVAEIVRLFHAALESGAEGLADADVAKMLAREIEKIFAGGQAENTAEGGGPGLGGVAR